MTTGEIHRDFIVYKDNGKLYRSKHALETVEQCKYKPNTVLIFKRNLA